ncbi:unnamed protein product [Amoebophrya sp. A120]|nr:unnamed protein product [Amoebophrya sp. A120]|eukprot:GSA120T00020622001.1
MTRDHKSPIVFIITRNEIVQDQLFYKIEAVTDIQPGSMIFAKMHTCLDAASSSTFS